MPLLAAVGPLLGSIAGGVAAAAPTLSALGGIGSSIYGAVNQGNAINKAAQTQSDASLQAAQLQAEAQKQAQAEATREFNVNQGNLSPYMSAGFGALNARNNLLGLAPVPSDGDYVNYVQNSPDLLKAFQDPTYNPNNLPMGQWGQQHWQTYGKDEAAQGLRTVTPGGVGATPGAIAGNQQSAIDQLKAGPLFQSLYNTGNDSILAHAAATGGLRGGNTQNSLARFGSDTLAQVIQQQLDNLGGISNAGLTAAGNLGSLNNVTGGQLNNANLTAAAGQGNDVGQAAGARAGGILGSANANNTLASTIASVPSIFPLLKGGGGGQSPALAF